MRSLASPFLLLTLATRAVLSLIPFEYHSDYSFGSEEEPFLTLWNIPVHTCVRECQLRNACMAVNYWKHRRECEMLLTDGESLIQQNASKQGCIFIRKSEVQSLNSFDMTTCLTCNNDTACDVTTSTCVIKECRRLHIDNGVVYGNMLGVGSRVKIVCDENYILNSPQPQSVCQGNGSWDNVPTCIPNTAFSSSDGYPVLRQHGVVYGNMLGVGSRVKIVCDENYILNSPQPQSVCQGNGSWDNVPTCIPNTDCDEPPGVDNATVTSGATMNGSERFYTCNAGHSNLNNAPMNVTCQINRTWTAVAFECVQDCDEPPYVENANVSPGAIIQGSERNYTCNVGHSETNNVPMTVTCQQGQTWTTVAFECVQDCDEPPGVDNATVTSGATMQGSERKYTCNVGYSDINNALMTVTCQQSGTWTAVAFECMQDCIAPPSVVNAAVSPGATLQGSVRSYTCNAGYSEINNAPMTVTCQQDGTWTSVVFECVQDCFKPPYVENATVSPGANMQGSERSYTCNVGVSKKNNVPMAVTCQQDGTWTIVSFDCVQVFVCPSDTISFHHAVLKDGTTFQFRVFLDATTDFYGAGAKCAAEGGSLYQVLTLAKMDFTLQLTACPAYQSNKFWIDGIYNIATSVYETTNGTPLPMSHDFWAPLDPNAPGPGRCVRIKAVDEYKWNDADCVLPAYSLCEMF